ncbi:MAG: fibrobacter succinogenes major paralogous domain-containing protein [Bacteroidetes bacterium]|nr:fibrobacter succinogenes major paralogous domain-containing protein [Bacteroidota bacterium]
MLVPIKSSVVLFSLVCVFSGCGEGSSESEDSIPTPKKGLNFNGYTYSTVIIGKQEWTTENLRTTTFSNGVKIKKLSQSDPWPSDTTGAFCAYDYNETFVSSNGYLYDWYAVGSGLLAPAGWRVATDQDWKTLVDSIGGNITAATKLKSTDGWGKDNNGTNEFGFNVLPSGYRTGDLGTFHNSGTIGYFWSSTAYNEGNAWSRDIRGNSSQVTRDPDDKRNGYSVRLVRDIK